MDNFCSNEECILNRLIVPDEQIETDVAYPDGSVGEMVRILMVDGNQSRWYCHACANAISTVLKGERVRNAASGITASGVMLPGRIN